MRKQDIKPGVVYAYQRSASYSPEPIVFLNAPKDGALYHESGRYGASKGAPAYIKAGANAKPHASRGAWASAGDTGYPAVMIYRHGEDEATVDDLLAVTLEDFEAVRHSTVKGVQYIVVTSLGIIAGEWAEVSAAFKSAQDAAREAATRQREAADASRTRAIDILTALQARGLKPHRIPTYGAVDSISLSLDEAEKLLRLLGQER